MQELEQQLIKGLVARDKSAFEMLFRAYYSSLVVIANDILHNSGSAEEVVQDVFVKIWKIGPELSVNSSLSAYLIGMVRNRSIDYLRNKTRQIKTVSIDGLDIQEKLHELGTDTTIMEEELFSGSMEVTLKQALEQLPPQCKQIFILNRFDGYSPKEISQMLEISISTVKTQISRALFKLKDAIKGINS